MCKREGDGHAGRQHILAGGEAAGSRLFSSRVEELRQVVSGVSEDARGQDRQVPLRQDGEVGQQYRTGIGIIDILAQDKKTKQLVVIELKKNQTSDDTVGQLARYMGWLETHKTEGKPTKGIIIAAQYDQRLEYALKKFPGAEIYLYRVDFRLEEFRDGAK